MGKAQKMKALITLFFQLFNWVSNPISYRVLYIYRTFKNTLDFSFFVLQNIKKINDKKVQFNSLTFEN